MRRTLLGALGALLGGLATAHAAKIVAQPTADPALELIVVAGKFEEHDGEAFATLTAKYPHAIISFESPGGALIAGLQMGNVIRLRHYATFVHAGAMCASACAIAWTAGTPRFMQDGSRIGFHSAYNTGDMSITGPGNALIGAYLSRLGLSDAAIVYLERAKPDDITWLTLSAAQDIGMEVRLLPTQPASPQLAATPSLGKPPSLGQIASARPAPLPAALPPQPIPLSRFAAIPPPAPLPAPAPAPTPTQLAEIASKSFVSEYFAQWSETNARALGYFGEAYAARVNFYGKPITRTALIAAKRDYSARWPIRVYNARMPTLRTDCNPSAQICIVTGIVDWDCRNPERRIRSTGSANFTLTLALTAPTPQIVAETGSVISRTLN